MRKPVRYLLSVIIAIISSISASFGQISFEKGYIIDQDGKRISCTIKNNDWKNSPKEIRYKPGGSDSILKGNNDNVREFGIDGGYKYICRDVEIDLSSVDINNLSTSRNPEWQKERPFLKVLVEGAASLYEYKSGNTQRFFFSVSDSTVNQLIFKEYVVNSVTKEIKQNNTYRQQLWVEVNNGKISMNEINRISYSLADLSNYFNNYNQSLGTGNSAIFTSQDKNKRFINLKIAPSIDIAKAQIYNTLSEYYDAEFDIQTTAGIGIESEFILPFNKNKWSLPIELSYHSFEDDQYLILNSAYDNTVSVNYQTIDLALGIRYYVFLNNDLKLFANAQINQPFNLSSSKINYKISGELDIRTRLNSSLGFGVDYKRLSIESRFYTKRNITSSYQNWICYYDRFSFIIGYKIIKAR